MTRNDRQNDDTGKRIMAPLRQSPTIDPQAAAEARKQFLMQGEQLRQDLIASPAAGVKQRKLRISNWFGIFQHRPALKVIAAVILAALVIISGSGITIAAAQGSLPGDSLYSIKSWSEDIRLTLTHSTNAKLNLTLDLTNRRVNEISSLLESGKALDDRSSDRFQKELDSALQLAAQLDDTQIYLALGQIKKYAAIQGLTIEELINKLPPQAEPAIIHLQNRLAEQVQLSTFGETDPNAFREQIRTRLKNRQDQKHLTETEQSESNIPGVSATPEPGQNDKDNGDKTHKPTDVPDQGNPGNGNGKNTPGNGNHGPDETGTPEP